MRLSSLVISAVLLFHPLAFAQHSSGASASSSASGSSSSASSSGSFSSSGGYHGSSSSTSSSGGSYSGRTSSISNSSAGRNSSNNGVRGGNTATSSVRSFNATSSPIQPEHRGFFGFLRHPLRKPQPKPDLAAKSEVRFRPKPCPAGQTRGKGGVCATTAPYLAECATGTDPSTGSCTLNLSVCEVFRGRVRTGNAQWRSLQAQMQRSGCNSGSASQECELLRMKLEAARSQYRDVIDGSPVDCRGVLLSDPYIL